MKTTLRLLLLLAVTICPDEYTAKAETDRNPQTVGTGKGWLVIVGGGMTTNEVKERFVAWAGGPDSRFVVSAVPRKSEQFTVTA